MYVSVQVPNPVSIPTTCMQAGVANCICPPCFFWGGGIRIEEKKEMYQIIITSSEKK
jgi:hypothetical protein